MTLNLDATWSKPIAVRLAPLSARAIYECEHLDKIPEQAGVYVFGRRYGKAIAPLYIGSALNLRLRIEQQLDSVRLMTGIRNAENGPRFLMYCVPRVKKGQKIERVIRILEDTLIDHALSEGYELLLVKGTKRPAHKIRFHGHRESEALAPRFMRSRFRV